MVAVAKFAAVALIVAATARATLAGDGCQRCRCADPCRAGLMLCCPDDYCRKPMPCVPCPSPCCSCDDYCRKPMPCVCYPALPVNYSCGSCISQQ